MPKLLLDAKGKEQELVLAYLQKNGSDVLTDKINNGVVIEKDGKRLTNRKTLDGFMTFAYEEARKQAEKNTRCACVPDETVYGWAIHYFEEDTIEGTLLSEDGTVYEPLKPKQTAKPAASVITTKPQSKPQPSLFDLMTLDNEPKTQEDKPVTAELNEDNEKPDSNPEDDEEIQEILAELAEEKERQAEQNSQTFETPKPNGLPFYQRYTEIQSKYPDRIGVFRLGDFYEIFGDDAVTIANELNLTLTSRDCGLTERVPMVGFPYHAADSYFGKLIGRDHKLAVVESLDDTKLLEKPDREVIEVIDPETGEVLSEAEMRLFDGDVEEPKSVKNNNIPAEKQAVPSAFDSEALKKFDRALSNLYILR